MSPLNSTAAFEYLASQDPFEKLSCPTHSAITHSTALDEWRHIRHFDFTAANASFVIACQSALIETLRSFGVFDSSSNFSPR